jgi:transposase InsO family protein
MFSQITEPSFTNKLIKSKKGNYCVKPSKLDVVCEENNIDHRRTKPYSPQTNGMVEKVNDTIKNGTIKRTTYSSYSEMEDDTIRFLVYYNLYRRHGSLRKELNVKTPLDAVKKWYELDSKLFKETPLTFEKKLLNLKQTQASCQEQPCET